MDIQIEIDNIGIHLEIDNIVMDGPYFILHSSPLDVDLDGDIYIDIHTIANRNRHLDRDRHSRKQRCTVCPLAQFFARC